VFIADKIAAIRAYHSCVNSQFLIVTYSVIEIIILFLLLECFRMFYGVIKVELEKQNKQFYTRVQEKNGKCTVRSEDFFGNKEIDEFEIKKRTTRKNILSKRYQKKLHAKINRIID
jgi:hypothetical protein